MRSEVDTARLEAFSYGVFAIAVALLIIKVNVREGKNPQTGETMHIEARKVPAFKAGKTFKESV